MKICLISPLFEPWNVGGAEKYINTLANALSKDHEVIVITTKGPKPRKSHETKSNLRVIELKQNNVNSLYSILSNKSSISFTNRYLWHLIDLLCFRTYSQIKKILEKEKPDIIHTNGIRGLSSFLFSAIKKTQTPHVHMLHDRGLMYPWSYHPKDVKSVQAVGILDRLFIKYMKKASSDITAVISPSQSLMDSYLNLGYFKNSKRFVVPHGIKLADDSSPKEGICKEFIFLGRIEQSKGPQIAVSAFKKIKAKNVKLHIVGTGSYLDTVKKLAQTDDRIIFHGHKEHQDVKILLEKCSCGIIPSIDYENFPLTTIEFMNKGLPVLASNIGGISEQVKDGENGFLFDPGDAESLQHLLERLIDDKNILNRLSKNAIATAKNFSIEKQLKHTMDIYTTLLE